MPKKIVICCDGTGNEIKENQSNVLKFYRVLKESPDQIGFYDPGVGTISNSGAWATFKNKAKGVFGLATGNGLDNNVLDAYRFLVRTYDHAEDLEDCDEIYLFGFSRGAHTVRMLAGFINMVGILHPHQEHLAAYALTAYKQSSSQDEFDIAWRVQKVLATRRPIIRFMGCWDTVASVIVPRWDRIYWPLSLESLPYTRTNPCVKVFRHACAIDERRRMFRLSRWTEPQIFKEHPFVKREAAGEQDIQQVWFAGVHGDVGGGYPEQQSGAAKYPLEWMVQEAEAAGLVFRKEMAKRLVRGENPSDVEKGSRRDYAKPSPVAQLHDSMTWAWKALEYLPKKKKHHDDPSEKEKGGWYIPLKEPRYIPDDAIIHPSVLERHLKGPDYDPPNLPSGWQDRIPSDDNSNPDPSESETIEEAKTES